MLISRVREIQQEAVQAEGAASHKNGLLRQGLRDNWSVSPCRPLYDARAYTSVAWERLHARSHRIACGFEAFAEDYAITEIIQHVRFAVSTRERQERVALDSLRARRFAAVYEAKDRGE